MTEFNIWRTVPLCIVALIICAGCAQESKVVAHERPAEFYSRFVNSADHEKVAAQSLHELKILKADDTYRMRLALFDNGKVYYQVDRLGDGHGTWRYYKGALEINAIRPIFDMQFYVSAEKATGDSMLVRYYDRYGLNSHPISLRDPNAPKSDGDAAEPLPEFEKSTDGI